MTSASNLILLVLLQVLISLPAMAREKTDESCVFRTSNVPFHSNALGVGTISSFVVIDNVKHPGIYITEVTTANSLAKHMGLKQRYILLTMDGYSMLTAKTVDQWMAQRPPKPLNYTYCIVHNGKPKIYSREISKPPQYGAGVL